MKLEIRNGCIIKRLTQQVYGLEISSVEDDNNLMKTIYWEKPKMMTKLQVIKKEQHKNPRQWLKVRSIKSSPLNRMAIRH